MAVPEGKGNLADSTTPKIIKQTAEFLKSSKSKLGIKMPFFPAHQNESVSPLGLPKALHRNHKEVASDSQNPKTVPRIPVPASTP